MIKFKEYISNTGEVIFYLGEPNLGLLEKLSIGYGDIWHSSFEQGYKNAFQDLVYQTSVFFWYLSDFDNLDECVSWRLNPYLFAVRKSAWDAMGGFDDDFQGDTTKAFDFAHNALRYHGITPLYVKGLYSSTEKNAVSISIYDRYLFFRKNFKKIDHSLFMLYRKGLLNPVEWYYFIKVHIKHNYRPLKLPFKPRVLNPIEGNPTVSYIIPTMFRQEFTLNLLEDLKNQSYLPAQVVVVDATPVDKRDETLYNPLNYPFELIVKWQTTKGSCRARNEAIELCTSDYIIFGDDDVRFHNDFIENHIRFLQTYQVGACNGLDIQAANMNQNLDDLRDKLNQLGDKRWKAGASSNFSNANSCVKKEFVDVLEGNDINYDGGYGEDTDFGISLTKIGVPVLHNPYSANLHLKPPQGGYRFWGTQSKVIGKKRKAQPWELDCPVKWIVPVPSPTKMYQFYKYSTPEQLIEHRQKYFSMYLFKGALWSIFFRLLNLPIRILQFNKSVFYAKKLMSLGKRVK